MADRLGRNAGAVGVTTTGLVGAGGFGTTLTRMVAHDPRVRAEFDGGVVWMPIGKDIDGPELAAKVVSVARLFDPCCGRGDRSVGGRGCAGPPH